MEKTEIIAEIRQIVAEHKLTYAKIIFSKDNRRLADFISEQTAFLNDIPNIKKSTRIYCLLNGISEIPKCKICGKDIRRNIKSLEIGFAKYCSARCENSDPDVIARLRETNMKKYGCEWSFQSDNNKTKSKDTMLQKYGVEYAQQNRAIREKSKAVLVERYGVEYALLNKDVKERAKITSWTNSYNRISACKEIEPMFDLNYFLKHGLRDIYEWRCRKCGNVFKSPVDWSWFKHGQNRQYVRCEKCFPRTAGTSAGEKDMTMFLKTIYPGELKTKTRCLTRSNDGRNNLEIDVYCPEKHIGIEFDGLYFHSEGHGKPKNYHVFKTELAESMGIRLIHVFETEWFFKKEIVKSRLKNLFGVYDKTVYARKCVVKAVDAKTSNEFQNANHIQGAVRSKVSLGLYDGEDLVALMTFSKSRFSKKHEWELLRFCCKLGYHVPGGAGKLLKHFEKTCAPKSLVSYADRRWSRGGLYEALGFSKTGVSKPNYWYFKGRKLMSRINFQKHKLKKILPKFDENLSEKQNMAENGYNTVYDCGNLVYEKIY